MRAILDGMSKEMLYMGGLGTQSKPLYSTPTTGATGVAPSKGKQGADKKSTEKAADKTADRAAGSAAEAAHTAAPNAGK